MKRYIKKAAQVVLLTAVLVFGGLLVAGSFDASSWASSEHYGSDNYWGGEIGGVSIHLGGANYYNHP